MEIDFDYKEDTKLYKCSDCKCMSEVVIPILEEGKLRVICFNCFRDLSRVMEY